MKQFDLADSKSQSFKIFTSYFYQVRFFTSDIIPLSTAVWDPRWYHNFQNQDYVFTDKRINGLRFEMLMPDNRCSHLCHGREGCPYTPDRCEFLKKYYNQISELSFSSVINLFNEIIGLFSDKIEKPSIALLFHEAPDNPCSERRIIQKWFQQNNYDICEWHRSL